MNSYINSEESEIDLLSLVKYLLRRILWIVLAGVICAGVVGAYKYYSVKSSTSNLKTASNAQSEYVLSVQDYEYESEFFTISDASTLSLIKDHDEYLNNSLLMKLDPYHVWREQASVYISSQEKSVTARQIVEMFRQDLSNGYYLKKLADERNSDSSYLVELINVEEADSNYMQTPSSHESVRFSESELGVLLVDSYNDITSFSNFAVYVYGNKEEEAHALMQVVLDEIQDIKKKIATDYDYEVEIQTVGPAEVVDTWVRDIQEKNLSYTNTLAYRMKDNDDKAALLKSPSPSEEVTTTSGISKKSLLKYGLIGFVIGAFLMCLWYAFRYITNDKLVGYKDLEQKGLFLKELGSVSDQGIAMVTANIRNFAGEKKKLFLTGMAEESQFNKTCEAIEEYLPEYEIVYACNVLNDPASREKAINCDAAVLVEQKNVSCYSKMKEEITFLVNAEKDIVGIVII